jgi:hypothetical protein
MRLKRAVIAVVSCLLLVAIGIGLEDIYCAYFHGRSGFTLIERSSLAGGGLYITGPDAASEDTSALAAWAGETGSAVAVIGDSPGIAVCDRSGGIKRLLERAGADREAPPLDESMRGVYLTNDAAYIGAYVKDGIFMPEVLALPVLGYYDEGRLPDDMRRPFFYPLSMMAGRGLYYLTDADELSGLERLIREAAPEDELTVRSAGLSAGEFIRLLIHDPIEARSRTPILYAIISLSLCFVFGGLMLYREHKRELVIRHLFGMSLRKIKTGAALISAAVTGSSLLLFILTVRAAGRVRLEGRELKLLACAAAAVYMLLAAIVNAAGTIGLKGSIKRGMRYEDSGSGRP